MSSVKTASELRFEPPGPGSWGLDPVHFPRPVTRYWAETHPEPFARGVAEFTRHYGMMLGGIEDRYVNGFCYGRHLPLDDAEVPERFQRAEQAFGEKLWREQLREWDKEFKPASIAKHMELQSVDPDTLSNEELAAHLRRCRDHHSEMIYQHMRFTAAPSVPTGDFLVHVGQWTGLSQAELLGLLRGSAPVSAGTSNELDRLRRAVAVDSAAQAALASHDDAATVLETLRTLEGETGAAASAYLDLVGYRLLDGFDISGPYALELPDALLRAIRIALDSDGAEGADVEDSIVDVRAKVPPEHQAEFDELLAEARLTYRMRDERGVYSDIWASGIMRRAALAAGRRLRAAGRLEDAEHIVDAGLEEMCAMLGGAGEPTAAALRDRADARAAVTAKDAPAYLGDPPSAPPDPSRLPPAAQRMMRAMGLVMGSMFGSSEAEHEQHLLRGLAASPGTYEGVARRIAGPTQFDRIVQGDVLVTESTTEAFNILLPLLGAIVTDSGGLLSHSAIVAREYGIPGVVGTRTGTDAIPDGARVRVDGTAGEVMLLS